MKSKFTLTVKPPFGLDQKFLILISLSAVICLNAIAYLKDHPLVYQNANYSMNAASISNIQWNTAASQPFSVSEAQGETLNGNLYSFGGFDSQKGCCTPTSRAYKFEPSLNRWTALAPMPAMNGTSFGGVTHSGFCNDGTDIYFAGGYTSNSSGTGQIFGTREVWKYVVAENRYDRLPDLPIAISAGQMEFIDGKLHHIGGTNSSRTMDLGNHYVLDLNNIEAGWTTAAPLPNPRQHAGSAVYGGMIYYIGGQNGHDDALVTSNDVHRYNPANDTWTQVADLPVPAGATGRGHISSAGFVFEDRILVIGGETVHNSPTNMVSAYDPSNNTWSDLTPLPAARRSGTAGVLNGNIYYAGGGTSTTYKGNPILAAAEECSPLSTLPCEDLQVAVPFSLNFNQSVANTISDKNGQGIGFTMVNPISGTRTSADGSPSNSLVPGYEDSKLTLTNGALQLVTNKGIFSRTDNNQLNALGVRVDSRNRLQIDATIINPFNGSSFQQGGVWFGLNDRTFIKLVVVGNKVEMIREINDSSTNYPEDQRITGTISGLNTQTVRLRLIVDPETSTAEAFYSTNGTTYLNAGESYAIKTIDISGMGITSSTAYAGIFGTHRNSSTPVTYTFDDFSVTGTTIEPDPEPTPTACSPISTLPCSALQVNLPLNLNFNQAAANTIVDKSSMGTGFTLVNNYSGTRLSADGPVSNSDVPGYEPSRLTLGSGRLQILSNKGINYLTNNNQLNNLGVQFNGTTRYQIETVLINPFNGSSAQQAGIWLGQNDKTFLKLVVVGNKVEFRKEVNDVSSSNDVRVTGTISGLNNMTVTLRLVVDPATNIAEATYSTDGSTFLSVESGELGISGMNITGSAVLAGVFATHRSSSTPVTYTFDNFSITGTTTEPDPTPTACSPISTLPCSAVPVNLPLSLNFNQAMANSINDKNSQGTGFTLVDNYSGTRLSADGPVSNSDVPGYEPSRLTLGSGRLQILSNKGISYLTNNNQLNNLGVQFNGTSRYQIETVLINPFNGSSAQQAGIWIGQNDKTFLKLVVVGNKVEFRKEINDLSGSDDMRVTGTISGLNNMTVTLRLIVDPSSNVAEAAYSTDGTSFSTVGNLSISGMGLTGNIVMSGIFATHRNSSTPVTYTFDSFNISNPTVIPDSDPEPVETNPNAYMVLENMDKFPAADHLVFSRIETPWNGMDNNTAFNYNHDRVTLRVHNKGTSTLTISDLSLSNSSLSTAWKIARINSDNTAALPVNITSRGFADIVVEFTAVGEATRVKTIHDTLYITSSDPTFPLKKVMVHGNYQRLGEGGNEPRAQEILNTFAFKTRTGFSGSDGSTNRGTVIVPNSDEVIPSFFVRADPVKPVTVTQMAAFHSCCNTRESFQWYVKGSTTNTTLFSHYAEDGQTVLPRLNSSTATTSPVVARGTFNPTGAFGIKSGTAYSDRTRNFEGKIGMRIWKAIDATGNLIPNAYIIGTDYLGTDFTNYDYQDNIYYIENVRPETGTAYYAELGSQPSAVSFPDINTGSNGNLTATLRNLGTTYSDGSSDPNVQIQKIEIIGPNAGEFSATMPSLTTVAPQGTTSVPVRFSPTSFGIKNAALMVYYNNAKSPLRIPLYGISNSNTTTVSNIRRIKSNASSSITIAGETWEADINYRKGNVKLDTQNPKSNVAGTDDDVLYQTYLSSNANFDEIRYEIPLANGNYMIRMHHVENVWQAPGLRVFDVTIENQLKYSFLDIFKEVGFRAALVKDYETTVTDGILNIRFNPTSDRLAIAGLEIFAVNTTGSLMAQDIEKLSTLDLFNESGSSSMSMRTYPNPNSGDRVYVTLENFGKREPVTIQMHDIMGRLVKSVRGLTDDRGYLSTEIRLDASPRKEIYIIRASSPSGIKQSKLIIE